MRTMLYPKTYGVIIEKWCVIQRIGQRYTTRQLSAVDYLAQLATSGFKKKWILHKVVLRVRLDNGICLDVDPSAYQGKRSKDIYVGKEVKLYKRPQDRRPWAFKLIGE